MSHGVQQHLKGWVFHKQGNCLRKFNVTQQEKLHLISRGKLKVTSIKITSNIAGYVDHFRYTLHEQQRNLFHLNLNNFI
jgi:hypothetical protein